MRDATVREQAIQAVIDSLPPNSARDPKIIDDFPLRSGHVFEVLFNLETVLSKYAHYGHGEFRVFSRSRELIQFIVRSERQHNAAIHLLQVAGIPGITAIIIIVTICVLFVRGEPTIPGIFEHALTLILGFYFASSVYETSKVRKD